MSQQGMDTGFQSDDPLLERYAGKEMREAFSPRSRYSTWRRLWVALAQAQAELGVPIQAAQIASLRRAVDDIDFDRVRAIEREVRHDVVAHIRAFAEKAPEARGIIHHGATSAFITDNADLILMRDGLRIIEAKLLAVLAALRQFALRYRDLPTLAYTHYQPAQLTTVGKRASLWAQDFLIDLLEVAHRLRMMRFRGAKGSTGTQANFLRMFSGDAAKVDELDRSVARAFGFEDVFPITGQTYPRKEDSLILGSLRGIGESAHKFSNDIRLLQHDGEIEEPFEEKQVGSSTMPYKRNPMRCERIGSLSKYLIAETANPSLVASTQWLERTLDDSANRRMTIPRSFLAADAILILTGNVVRGLEVHEATIRHRVGEEIPFMATEDILTESVARGGDRQALHEKIRVHAMGVRRRLAEGGGNDLLDRIAGDAAFASVRGLLPSIADPRQFTGRASEQVEIFFRDHVDPHLEGRRDLLEGGEDVLV